MKARTFVVQQQYHGKRIDSYLAEQNEDLSRSYIQNLINSNKVCVQGREKIKPNYKVKQKDLITIFIDNPKPIEIVPQNIPLDIVYEDDSLIIVNKPQGMVVHPAPGNYSGTLVNALLAYCKDLSGINGKIRPGIVHRLDKDTSGILLVAKTNKAHINLAEQIKSKKALRKYIALVYGNIKENSGIIDLPIGRHPKDRKKMAVVEQGARHAVTHFKVLERFRDYTLIEARLETGRTHQIRVHMSHIGHPVVGDAVYGSRKCEFNLNGQLLHARVLGFNHPETGEYMEFTAPLPDYFDEIIQHLSMRKSQ